jgi:hypothetical protein
MIVYHGSNKIVKNPDISFSKPFLDFGKGFYVTDFQKQAEKWASRKAMRYGGEGFVNSFEMQDDLSAYKVLKFENEDENWLEFVCECRRGSESYKNYDIIAGKVANDDVFKTVNMYFQGFWDKQRALEELRYSKANDQICIVNADVLAEILKFKNFYKVISNG